MNYEWHNIWIGKLNISWRRWAITLMWDCDPNLCAGVILESPPALNLKRDGYEDYQWTEVSLGWLRVWITVP